MAHAARSEFIEKNHDELIGRCRAKVANRPSPALTEAEIAHGVPLFLDQLCEELRHGPSKIDLNRALDDAIAGAVTEYAHGQDVTRDGDS